MRAEPLQPSLRDGSSECISRCRACEGGDQIEPTMQAFEQTASERIVRIAVVADIDGGVARLVMVMPDCRVMMLVDVLRAGVLIEISANDSRLVGTDRSNIQVEVRWPPHPIHGKRKYLKRQGNQDKAGNHAHGERCHRLPARPPTAGCATPRVSVRGTACGPQRSFGLIASGLAGRTGLGKRTELCDVIRLSRASRSNTYCRPMHSGVAVCGGQSLRRGCNGRYVGLAGDNDPGMTRGQAAPSDQRGLPVNAGLSSKVRLTLECVPRKYLIATDLETRQGNRVRIARVCRQRSIS